MALYFLLGNLEKLNLPAIEAKINLEENKTFYPGDNIKGSLNIRHSQSITLFGLLVSLEGHSRIKFTKHNLSYSENRLIGIQYWYLLGEPGEDGHMKKLLLKPGTHELPFTVTVPKSITMSYKDEFGQLTYNIVGSLQCGNSIAKLATKSITINLNESIVHVHPFTFQQPCLNITRSENAFFYKNSGLKFNFKIFNFIFRPNDKIMFNLEILNNFLNKKCLLSIDIIQKFCYRIPLEETKRTSRVVCSYKKEIQNENNLSDFVKLINPDLLFPSHFGYKICIMDLEYFLKVELKQDSKILRGEIPIFMNVNCEEATLYTDTNETNNLQLPNSEKEVLNGSYMLESPLLLSRNSLPAYSQLSLASLAETLPPPYEKAVL